MRWEYRLQNEQRRGNLLRSERWLRSRSKRGRRRGSAFLSPTSRFSTSTSEIFMILTPRLGYITLLVFRGSLTATCETCVQALRLPFAFCHPSFTFCVIYVSEVYGYDKVPANTASWKSQCYKESDGSQDARRESPHIPNETSDW